MNSTPSLDKCGYISRSGAIYGGIIGIIESAWSYPFPNNPKLQQFKNQIKHTANRSVLYAAAGAAYGVTEYAAMNIRGKNDCYNMGMAGAAAGLMLGINKGGIYASRLGLLTGCTMLIIGSVHKPDKTQFEKLQESMNKKNVV